eukprot:Pompholyxophrys_punicea_v1_NODE_73_length_3747_cov_4.524377.p3 type:complete len:220 gc:universal NODE_73_length_3747_cov_4.524377:2549-1890(-)
MPRIPNSGPCFIDTFRKSSHKSYADVFGKCDGPFRVVTARNYQLVKPEYANLFSSDCVESKEQLCYHHWSLFIQRFSETLKPQTSGKREFSDNLLPVQKRVVVGGMTVEVNVKNGSNIELPNEDFYNLVSRVNELEAQIKDNPDLIESVNYCVSFLYNRKKAKLPEVYCWDSLISMLASEDPSNKFKYFLFKIYESCKPEQKDAKTKDALKKKVNYFHY